MDDFAHARNLVQPVQLVAPGSPLAPAQMFRNLLRENSSRTSMGFIARASRQKGVAQMRCLGPVPVAGVPISTGAAGDSRRICRLRPARLVVRRRGQRRPIAHLWGQRKRRGKQPQTLTSPPTPRSWPIQAGEVRRWKAGSPDWAPIHPCLAPHRMEKGGGCPPGFRRRSAQASTPPTRFCGRGATLPLHDPVRVAALAACSGWTAGR